MSSNPTPEQILKAAHIMGMPRTSSLDELSCYRSPAGDTLTWEEVGCWAVLNG